MYVALYCQSMFTHKPCEWCGSWKWVTVSLVMAMARRTWSVATGLARDTLWENLTCPTPSKDCFCWPGFLRGFLRGFWLFLPPPWTVQNGSERRMNGSGVFPPEKGMKKNLRKNSRKNSRNNPCKGFWTVQNGSERRMNGSGVFPLKKAWKTYVRTHVRTHVTTHVKVSERFVGK